jgi:hypothetical protein
MQRSTSRYSLSMRMLVSHVCMNSHCDASIAQSLIGLYVVIGQNNAPRKKLAAVEGIPALQL